MSGALLGRKRRGTLTERFWRAVPSTPSDPKACWLWSGSVNTHGYGQIRDEHGRYTTAHRIGWMLQIGSIPKGKSVLHHCDVRRCVRVSHLFLGTQVENVADKVAKRRQARGAGHGRSKLTERDVRTITRRLRSGDYDTYASLGSEFHVSYYAISDIARGRSWSHVSRGF